MNWKCNVSFKPSCLTHIWTENVDRKPENRNKHRKQGICRWKWTKSMQNKFLTAVGKDKSSKAKIQKRSWVILKYECVWKRKKKRRACRDESSVNKNMYRNEVNRWNMQMTVNKEYAKQFLNNSRKRQFQ